MRIDPGTSVRGHPSRGAGLGLRVEPQRSCAAPVSAIGATRPLETVTSSAVAGDKTFYEGVMEFVTDGTNVIKVERVVVDTWKGGQIVRERFYHA